MLCKSLKRVLSKPTRNALTRGRTDYCSWLYLFTVSNSCMLFEVFLCVGESGFPVLSFFSHSAKKNNFSSRDLERWPMTLIDWLCPTRHKTGYFRDVPMTLTYETKQHRVKMSHHIKYRGQWFFVRQLSCQQTEVHTADRLQYADTA